MRIRYEVTLDDLAAFARFHAAHSVEWKRQLRLQVLSGALGIVVITAAVARQAGMSAMVFGLPALLAWLVLTPRLAMRWYIKHAKRMYGEGTKPGLIGWRELQLNDDGITSLSAEGTMFTRFSAIGPVEREHNHGFIYVNGVQAHVIPFATVTEGDAEAFLEQVRSRAEPRH